MRWVRRGENRRVAERDFRVKVGGQSRGGRKLDVGERESNSHSFPVIHHCAK